MFRKYCQENFLDGKLVSDRIWRWDAIVQYRDEMRNFGIRYVVTLREIASLDVPLDDRDVTWVGGFEARR